MGGQVVQHHTHGPAAGHGVDLFEEPQHVGAAVALVQVGDHWPVAMFIAANTSMVPLRL
jgi:hypothetical protein